VTELPPLVSVLVPTYRRPALLREAVESALAQTYPAIEVVVGDDSPDDASQIAIADLIDAGRIRYVRHAPPHGQARNVDRLFHLAAGELLVLLHDDDLLLPDAVSSLAKCLEDPTVTVAFGKQCLIDKGGAVNKASSDQLNAAYCRTAADAGRQPLALQSGLTGQFPNDGYIVRTAAARRVGYRCDPKVGDACDLDFGIRLAADGGAFFFLDQYTAKYRTTEVSVLRSAGNNIAILAYNLIADVALPPELEPVRRDRLARYAPMVVSGLLAQGDKKSAWRVYTSGTYPWRRRMSPRGLFQAWLFALPSDLVRAGLAARRSLRRT
jgi:glycosyltransferase involved in cell wall biosynthesis